MLTDPAARPNTIPWPPILFLSALLAANLLTWAAPASVLQPSALLRLAGAAMAALSIGLMLWAFLAFRQHRTTVLPHQPASALITTAPFNLSRNPIYLAEAVLLAGLSLVNASVWYLVVIPLFVVAVTRLAIVREEAHLAALFGDAWASYARKVRRWF